MIFENLQAIIILLAILAVLAIIISGYVKAPTDRAFIISGFKKKPRVLIGRAGIKIPFLERKDELMLKQISIDIKTNGYIPTQDFIGVNIDAVAKIRVLTEKDVTIGPDGQRLAEATGDASKYITLDMVEAAMKNFLNMKEEEIRLALTDSLQGNMREIIGTQSLKELCNDRKTFGDEVQSKAQKDMNALGIWIESCNIQSIMDEQDLISSLGQDNMSKIQKDASIAKAQADRDVEIAKAEANKASNDAQVKADTDIAVKQNELRIKKAELKMEADTRQAEADAAYKIQDAVQRKTIGVTETDANIAKQEREVELKRKEAEVKEQELSATVKKQAEAEKYRRQQEAEAKLIERQKESEARRYEKEQEAEALKVSAEAKLFEAEKEAAGIRARGTAEAEAIRAKAIAEAEGIDKKAEAMTKMKDAAILEMYFKVLPEVAREVAAPLGSIDRITMYGEGNTARLVEDITKATTQVTEGLTQSLGFDVKSVLAGALGGKIQEKNEKNEKMSGGTAAEAVEKPSVPETEE